MVGEGSHMHPRRLDARVEGHSRRGGALQRQEGT